MKTPAPVRGDGAGAKIKATSNSYRRSSTASRPARQCRCPETTAPARLQAQSERLAWLAYMRAVHLQWAEPGPTSDIIRHAVFKVWEQTFLGQASS